MTTTAAPTKLPKLDVDRIEGDEQARVAEMMGRETTDAGRLKTAATIIENAATTASPEALAKRDAAALHLSLYDSLPQVHLAVGLSRAYFHDKRIKALDLQPEERGTWLHKSSKADVALRAADKQVPRVENAREVAVALAHSIVAANARARAARAVRDDAVVALHKAGWSRTQIAELGRIDVSRVSQIVGMKTA